MAIKNPETKESPSAIKTVSGYLGALRAGVPHYGFGRDPLRIDYVIKGPDEDGKTSIRLDFTDIGFNSSKEIGSYVMEIEESNGPKTPRITFYKGKKKEESLAFRQIADPDLSRINTKEPKELIKKCAIDLLVSLAEGLNERAEGHKLSLEEHLETSRTMQVLAVIRQAAVDSQGASKAWADPALQRK